MIRNRMMGFGLVAALFISSLSFASATPNLSMHCVHEFTNNGSVEKTQTLVDLLQSENSTYSLRKTVTKTDVAGKATEEVQDLASGLTCEVPTEYPYGHSALVLVCKSSPIWVMVRMRFNGKYSVVYSPDQKSMVTVGTELECQ